MKIILVVIFIASVLIVVASIGYEIGEKYGLSQCYPYAVPYSSVQGQVGKQ